MYIYIYIYTHVIHSFCLRRLRDERVPTRSPIALAQSQTIHKSKHNLLSYTYIYIYIYIRRHINSTHNIDNAHGNKLNTNSSTNNGNDSHTVAGPPPSTLLLKSARAMRPWMYSGAAPLYRYRHIYIYIYVSISISLSIYIYIHM